MDEAAQRPGPRIALILFLLFLAVLATRQPSSTDLGFHLRAGEEILSGGGWPRLDSFTYTVNDHEYVDTSWGYQVVLAAINKIGGAPGLAIFQTALVLAVFYMLYLTVSLVRPAGPALVLLFLLSAIAVEMRIEVRPEWLTYLFLSVVLYLLHRYAEGRVTPLWLLPLIFLAWSNSHSLFILGWAALAAFVCGLTLRDRRIDLRLAGFSALSVGVAIINPYGWKALLLPITLLTRMDAANPFSQSIGELLSPFETLQRPFYPRLSIWAILLFIALVVLLLPPLFRQKRFPAILLALIFIPLALSAVRNIPLPVVACLPGAVWASSGGKILHRLIPRAEARLWLGRGLLLAAGVSMLVIGWRAYTGAYYIADRRHIHSGIAWNRSMLPVDAAEYVKRVHLGGRMLNALDFGAHLMWALQAPVFIDSRLEVIGEDFYSYYNAVFTSEELFDRCVERYDIRWTIFPFRKYPQLLGRLTRDRRWRLSYSDHLAALFVLERGDDLWSPDSADDRPPCGPHEVFQTAVLPGLGELPRKVGAERWLAGFRGKQTFPSEDYERGQFHYFRGEVALAGTHFARAIEQSGGAFHEIYGNFGMVLYLLQRYPEAQQAFRVMLSEDPGNTFVLEKLQDIESRLNQ